jgi:hypothetical protein
VSDWKQQITVRHWLNLETFILCVEDVALVRKVNLTRMDPFTHGMSEKTMLVPGLEIVCGGKITEIDYLEETHRDQVYDAIWAEIAKMGAGK